MASARTRIQTSENFFLTKHQCVIVSYSFLTLLYCYRFSFTLILILSINMENPKQFDLKLWLSCSSTPFLVQMCSRKCQFKNLNGLSTFCFVCRLLTMEIRDMDLDLPQNCKANAKKKTTSNKHEKDFLFFFPSWTKNVDTQL